MNSYHSLTLLTWKSAFQFNGVFTVWLILMLESASSLITSTTQEGFQENTVAMLMIPKHILFSGMYKNIEEGCIYYLIFIIYCWLQGIMKPSADQASGGNTPWTFDMAKCTP